MREIRHFTIGQAKEQLYGETWNKVVKEYLKSGYKLEQKEYGLKIKDIDYKVLKRNVVTTFYDQDGNTLFDITNERLACEYNDMIKSQNSELIKEQAIKKLEEELKQVKDKNFAEPVIGFLIERCKESEALVEDICQSHKTWEKCYKYIREKARKQASEQNSCAVKDEVVYEWAEDYYHKDDKAEEENKTDKKVTNKPKEQKQAERKEKKSAPKPKIEAKKIEKSNTNSTKNKFSNQMTGQLSMFDLM